jgi:hypothetical protein
MDTPQSTQPQSFEKTDYIALYIHYEERGAEIRGQMISTLTLLYAFLVPLLGFLGAWMFNPPDGANRQIALWGSRAGLALSFFSLVLVVYFWKHTARNYAMSKAVRCACDVLNNELERVRAKSFGISEQKYREKKEQKELEEARAKPLGISEQEYREKKELAEARSWLPKKWTHVFRLEPTFFLVSLGLTLFFACLLQRMRSR